MSLWPLGIAGVLVGVALWHIVDYLDARQNIRTESQKIYIEKYSEEDYYEIVSTCRYNATTDDLIRCDYVANIKGDPKPIARHSVEITDIEDVFYEPR